MTFDELDFFESHIHRIEVESDRVTVRCSSVLIVDGNGALPGKTIDCTLRFSGVSRSERRLVEYAVNSSTNKFKKPTTAVDVPTVLPGPQSRTFFLEGMLDEPSAWIDSWEIVATACEILDVTASKRKSSTAASG